MKQRGMVKYWNCARGAGSISPDDGGPVVYVHASCVTGEGKKNLMRGQFVEYELGANYIGPIAYNVRGLRPDEVPSPMSWNYTTREAEDVARWIQGIEATA